MIDVKSPVLQQRATEVYFVHDYYGCESGCCGCRWYVVDKNDNVLAEEFDFLHDNDPALDYAEEIARALGIKVNLLMNDDLENSC